MRICIIGSGIAGLSAAFYLTGFQDVRVTIYEQASVFGGRASVTNGGEHCARIFLSDYDYLFSILRVLRRPDNRSVYDMLRTVDRHCYVDGRGWVQISHLYVMLARDLSIRERVEIARQKRRSPLLAKQGFGANQSMFRLIRHITPISLLRIVANTLRSKVVYALEGSTAECLIIPWVSYLTERGVSLKSGCRVNAIQMKNRGVTIRSTEGVEDFDAVIIASHLSDAIELLATSGIAHSASEPDSLHWKCLTFTLSAEETILHRAQNPAIYSRDGINVLLQPRLRRCVVLCIRSRNTELEYVIRRVREFLALEHEIADVEERENRRPRESVFVAGSLKPKRILEEPNPSIYIAGSYIKNSYPIDSGEGAVRSAFAAVEEIKKKHHLLPSSAITQT
jgi:hypothetical protein